MHSALHSELWSVQSSAPSAAELVARVEALVASRPEADLASVARALGVAPRTLQRVLAEAATPFQVVRTRVRLALATRLLLEPGSKVECVARDVGFASTPHFIGWFRRHHGANPSDYRRAARAS